MDQRACQKRSSLADLQVSNIQPDASERVDAAVSIFPVIIATALFGPIAIKLSAVFVQTSARILFGFTSSPPKQAPAVAANFGSDCAMAHPRMSAFFHEPQ